MLCLFFSKRDNPRHYVMVNAFYENEAFVFSLQLPIEWALLNSRNFHLFFGMCRTPEPEYEQKAPEHAQPPLQPKASPVVPVMKHEENDEVNDFRFQMAATFFCWLSSWLDANFAIRHAPCKGWGKWVGRWRNKRSAPRSGAADIRPCRIWKPWRSSRSRSSRCRRRGAERQAQLRGAVRLDKRAGPPSEGLVRLPSW